MRKSQGYLSITANSGPLHQGAVCQPWLSPVAVGGGEQALLELWAGGVPSLLAVVMLPFMADLAMVADP